MPAPRHEFAAFRTAIQEAVAGVVVGMEDVVDQLLIALVARGHALLEGVPGTAKTTLAKTFAAALGLDHRRVQFTPDLLPSDVVGGQVLDRRTNDFVVRKGPVFCQLLLADEINRAPAKTQSALLEAMQEQQATIEGDTFALPQPFLVIATQNPVEQEGVYRLPEAQLDRFLVRIKVEYPSRDTEIGMLRLVGGLPDPNSSAPPPRQRPPAAMFDTAAVLRAQELLREVYAEPSVPHYLVDLARRTREHPDLILGASPRATLSLLQASRARALLLGRAYCTHEDVHAVAESVLCHRLILKPEAEIEGRTVEEALAQCLAASPVLKARVR